MNNDVKQIIEFEKLKQKFSYLEKRHDNLTRIFTVILSSITGIFILVGIIMTVLSVSSKSEIDNAIKNMEAKFDKLAGLSQKEAKIEIFSENTVVSNTKHFLNSQNNVYRLESYYIKNIGLRTTSDIKLVVFSDIQISTILYNHVSMYWYSKASSIDEYPYVFEYDEKFKLNPNEIFSFKPFSIKLSNRNLENGANIKLKIFYDTQSPTEMKFVLSK